MAGPTVFALGFGVGAASATSNAFTPTAGRRLYALAVCRKGTSTTNIGGSQFVDSTGGTWTAVGELAVNGTTPSMRAICWTMPPPASPVSMTVTYSNTGSSARAIMFVVETEDAAIFTNVNYGTGAGGSITATLGNTPSTTVGTVIGIAGFSFPDGTVNAPQFTPPSGYTELYDNVHDSALTVAPLGVTVAYHPNAPSTTAAWTVAGAGVGAELIFEIRKNQVTLTTGAITVASSDVVAAMSVPLDAGAITVTGSDLLAALSAPLDTGSINLAGIDLSAALTAILDTGSVTVAGADILAPTTVTLDTGAITLGSSDIIATVGDGAAAAIHQRGLVCNVGRLLNV